MSATFNVAKQLGLHALFLLQHFGRWTFRTLFGKHAPSSTNVFLFYLWRLVSQIFAVLVCLRAILLFSLLWWNSWCSALECIPLHPYMLALGREDDWNTWSKRVNVRISFSVVFTHPPPSHHGNVWLLPVISRVLANTVPAVQACISIWLERFRGSPKEDERGPLSIQSSLAWEIYQPLTSKAGKIIPSYSSFNHPSSHLVSVFCHMIPVPHIIQSAGPSIDAYFFPFCRSLYFYWLHVNLANASFVETTAEGKYITSIINVRSIVYSHH